MQSLANISSYTYVNNFETLPKSAPTEVTNYILKSKEKRYEIIRAFSEAEKGNLKPFKLLIHKGIYIKRECEKELTLKENVKKN
ncbi:Hypothetical protein HVR_LOCUS245 [uncultured virus]|nr:Hypothetical protein HVR_LOCUS245 [uncultured virus]